MSQVQATQPRAAQKFREAIPALLVLLIGGWLLYKYISWDLSDAPPERTPAEENQLRLVMAEEQVRAALKDGGSAEFSDVVVRPFQGAWVACGNVNARNSFGGYAGKQSFIYGPPMGAVLAENMKPGEFKKAWATFCQ